MSCWIKGKGRSHLGSRQQSHVTLQRLQPVPCSQAPSLAHPPPTHGCDRANLFFMQPWSVLSWKRPTRMQSTNAGCCLGPGMAAGPAGCRAVPQPWLPLVGAALWGMQQQLGLLPSPEQGEPLRAPNTPGTALVLQARLLQSSSKTASAWGIPVSAASNTGPASPSRGDVPS